MAHKGKFKYKHPRALITTDCVIFGFDGEKLKILLVKKEKEPFKNKWSLPGELLQIKASAEDNIKQVVSHYIQKSAFFIEQLNTYSDPNRNPEERAISVSYYILTNQYISEPIDNKASEAVEWFTLKELPKLAFDHSAIIADAIQHLQRKLSNQPIGFELLNQKFTLSQLQALYEAILNRAIDKRNFRKKILSLGHIKALNEKEKNVAHKAASLYKFDTKIYAELTKKGFHFSL